MKRIKLTQEARDELYELFTQGADETTFSAMELIRAEYYNDGKNIVDVSPNLRKWLFPNSSSELARNRQYKFAWFWRKATLNNFDSLIEITDKYKYVVSWDNPEVSRTHGSFSTYDEALYSIHAWWNQNEYVPRYVRVVGDIENRGKVTIDYGLHDSFYHIVKVKVGEKWTKKYSIPYLKLKR